MTSITVRRLDAGDLDFAHEMLLSEDWNDRYEDAERMLSYEPEGCFIAEIGQERVGHVFSVSYRTLAWIGYLIVKAGYRKKGIATMLMKKALDYLQKKKHVKTVKLEAVPEIADLYRKLGFTDEYDSLRFAGTAQHHSMQAKSIVQPASHSLIPDIAEFDAAYFGANRARVLSKLLDAFPHLFFVARHDSGLEGYIACRKAESGYKLGPWVCNPQKPKTAEQLLTACLPAIEPHSRIFIGTPAPNRTAVTILARYGFERYSRSLRMRLGPPTRDRVEGVFAIGGPMKG